MQRKEELATELQLILDGYPSDKSNQDAVNFLNKIKKDNTLSPEDMKYLITIKAYKGNDLIREDKDYIYLSRILLNYKKESAQEILKFYVEINKKNGKQPFIDFGETTLNILLTKKYTDLIYFALVNSLIHSTAYKLLANYDGELVNYILQLDGPERWDAFQFAFKHKNPLHLVIKERTDPNFLEILRETVKNSPMGMPTVVASHSNPSGYKPLYPSLLWLNSSSLYSSSNYTPGIFPLYPNEASDAPISTPQLGITPKQ